MYICRKFWFDRLFFENHDKLNIKKSVDGVTPKDRRDYCAQRRPHDLTSDNVNVIRAIKEDRMLILCGVPKPVRTGPIRPVPGPTGPARFEE
jgi:hypothetical protein